MPNSYKPPLRVLVPMKPLEDAKTRLWEGIPTLQRHGVILLMLHRVVKSAVDALGPGSCNVLGGDKVVRQIAEGAGAEWHPDHGKDLNSALWLSMQAVYAEGSRAALFLPADLPAITTDDVVAIALASEEYTVPVGVAAASDGGTNALLIPDSCAFAPLLGHDSFARHQQAFAHQGTPLKVLDRENLALDIDTIDDFERAKESLPNFATRVYDWQAWLHLGRQGRTPRI